jgi:hypothetical protein
VSLARMVLLRLLPVVWHLVFYQSYLIYLHGPQETENAPAASPVERGEELEPGLQAVLRALPAGAGAAAEPRGRVSGLQPPRVLRVPRVPEDHPRLEVHCVLRGQVSMTQGPISALTRSWDGPKLPVTRVSGVPHVRSGHAA